MSNHDDPSTGKPTLHYSLLSSASHRIRIALALKHIDYHGVTLDLGANEHHTLDYLALNPQGLVPTLITPCGSTLTQSQAILHWLEAQYPQRPLIPKDLMTQCNIMAFCNLVACDIHPLQGLRLANWLKSANADETVFQRVATRAISEGLLAAESLLKRYSGKYSFGESITAADVWLVPQVLNAYRLDMDLSALQRLLDIKDACLEDKAFSQVLSATA
jgi:maleylpyruvate isomerase